MNKGPRERGPNGQGQRGGERRDNGGGNGRPDNGRNFSGPRKSMGRSPSEYRVRLERLRGAREVEEIREAADAFLQHHQLPDDMDVLYKVLQHPTEKVVREALGQISSLLMQGRAGGDTVLEERLTAIAERASESSTQSFVEGVRSQLASMKKA